MEIELRQAVGELNNTVQTFIEQLEETYRKFRITFTINKIQVHKIIMSIVAPVQLVIDSTLDQNPHFLLQQQYSNPHLNNTTFNTNGFQESSEQIFPQKDVRRNFRNSALSSQEEKQLKNWVIQQKQMGKNIARYDIQSQARKLNRRYPNFQASDVWLKKFIHRANIQHLVFDCKASHSETNRWHSAQNKEIRRKFAQKYGQIQQLEQDEDQYVVPPAVGNINQLFNSETKDNK